ncbi:ankyrin repeat-containing domain protein [Xylariomycetidae sp. FL2044]|nr:ankyrin repeat-containing domain protein [Xylariomycetidae sp. FL2044]
MRNCSSLIKKTDDGMAFELAHFTVQEYLRKLVPEGRLGRFKYDPIDASRTLSERCLSFLTLDKFNKITLTADQIGLDALVSIGTMHPFYTFAAGYWPENAATFEATLPEEVKLLFHPRKANMFIIWLAQFVSRFERFVIDDYPRLLELFTRPDFSTLHVAAAISWPQLCNWLCYEHKANVNLKSPIGTPLQAVLCGPKSLLCKNIVIAYTCYNSFGEATRISATIEILLEDGANCYKPNGDDSVGLTALWICDHTRDAAPVIPFIRRGQGLAIDMVDKLYQMSHPDNLNRNANFLAEIFMGIRDSFEKHPHLPEVASLMSLVETESLSEGPLFFVHEQASFPTTKIADEDFLLSVGNAAVYNRVKELELLLDDPRFDSASRFGDSQITLVHIAAQSDSEAVLTMLLERGFDPCAQDLDGNTPVHLCWNFQLDALRILLDTGASTRTQDCKGLTIWHKASREVLALLKGMVPNRLELLRIRSHNGYTPFTYKLKRGWLEDAEFLCDICPSEEQYFASPIPILHLAAAAGSETLFEKLLQKGLSFDAYESDGSNPLHHIRHTASPEFVQYLTKRYNILEKDNRGHYPTEALMYHITENEIFFKMSDPLDPALVKRLLGDTTTASLPIKRAAWAYYCSKFLIFWKEPVEQDKANKILYPLALGLNEAQAMYSFENDTGQPGHIPLVLGISTLKEEVLQQPWITQILGLFLGTQRKLSNAKDQCLTILLKKSLTCANDALTRQLLSIGSSVYLKEGGTCVLEEACDEACLSTFSLLLAHANQEDAGDVSTIHTNIIFRLIKSFQGDSFSKLKEILQQERFDPNVKDNDEGALPAIVYAASLGRWDVVHLFLDHGAELFASSITGYNIATAAASKGNMRMLKLLEASQYDWSCTVNIFFPSSIGLSCDVGLLHVAAFKGQLKVLKFLYGRRHFINFEPRTREGYTPLHCAAARGEIATIRYLCEKGANMNSRNCGGLLPLDLALGNNQIDAARHLLRRGAEGTCQPQWNSLCVQLQREVNNGATTLSTLQWQRELLKVAIAEGNLEQCETLLNTNSCLLDVELPDCNGCSPIVWAANCRQPRIVVWLLSKGAKPERVDCSKLAPENQSPLTAVAADKFMSDQCLEPMLESALENGVPWMADPINAVHASILSDNLTALHQIIRHVEAHASRLMHSLDDHHSGGCQTPVARLSKFVLRKILSLPLAPSSGLIKSRWPELNNAQFDPPSPLHLAVLMNNLQFTHTLLKLGVDANVRDSQNRTPLFLATSIEMATCLLDHGAQIEARGRYPDKMSFMEPFAQLLQTISAADVGFFNTARSQSLSPRHVRNDPTPHCSSGIQAFLALSTAFAHPDRRGTPLPQYTQLLDPVAQWSLGIRCLSPVT